MAVVITRGEFNAEESTSYSVIAAPALAFVSVTPDTVQLPIAEPLSLATAWIVTGTGVDSIQGIVTLDETAYSANVNTDSLNITATISAVTTLTTGLYTLTADLTVISNAYGLVSLTHTAAELITILAPIPEPEIGAVSLSVAARYAGSETAVAVTASGLANILAFDSISLQLYRGATVYYEHSGDLQAGASSFQHTVPQSSFTGLDAGDYSIRVYISRNATVRCKDEATYRVVAVPSVTLTNVTPSSIQLPMPSSENIVIRLAVSGEGINTVTGTVGLEDTDYTQNVNASASQIFVSLFNVYLFTARGYAVSARLNVVSIQFGTASIAAVFNNALRVLAAPEVKNHKSGNAYLYNSFDLVHIFKTYISFKWVRRYNKAGEFILQLENTSANVRLIRSGNIIAKDNDDEAGFIEDITIGDKIEVKGAFISKMLSYRVVNFNSETPVNLRSTAEYILNWNFINSGRERAIPGFRIGDYSIASQSVLARVQNGSMLQWLEGVDAGFKVAFMPSEEVYEFTMYDGKPSDAVFCESFKNITDQQYYKQSAASKNVCIIELEPVKPEEPPEDTGEGEVIIEEPVQEPEPEPVFITVGNATGLERREGYIRAGRYPPQELGAQFLRQNEPTESLDVKIVDPYSPFEYKKDYDVGSIVTITSESYGVEITKNILELTEYFDRTGFHLYVVFGSIPRDLLTELQDQETRLEELEKEIGAEEDAEIEIDEELIEEIVEEVADEVLEDLIDLVIPEIVDEVFDMIEFPPLPDYLTEEGLRETIETVVNRLLDGITLPGGNGNHVIIDHLPATQAEIDTFPLNSEVLVYDPNNPYVLPSQGGTS